VSLTLQQLPKLLLVDMALSLAGIVANDIPPKLPLLLSRAATFRRSRVRRPTSEIVFPSSKVVDQTLLSDLIAVPTGLRGVRQQGRTVATPDARASPGC